MKPSDIEAVEHIPYFGLYIGQAPETSIVEGLEIGLTKILGILNAYPVEKHHYRYAEGKWTVIRKEYLHTELYELLVEIKIICRVMNRMIM